MFMVERAETAQLPEVDWRDEQQRQAYESKVIPESTQRPDGVPINTDKAVRTLMHVVE